MVIDHVAGFPDQDFLVIVKLVARMVRMVQYSWLD